MTVEDPHATTLVDLIEITDSIRATMAVEFRSEAEARRITDPIVRAIHRAVDRLEAKRRTK